MTEPQGSPFKQPPEFPDFQELTRVARAILVELKEQRTKASQSEGGYPLAWVIGDEATAPGAAQVLAQVKVYQGYAIKIYGYIIAAEESNTFEITWTDTQGARKIIVPTTSAGTIVVISEDVALNEGHPSVGDVAISNVNAGMAGLNYQACLLYKVVPT